MKLSPPAPTSAEAPRLRPGERPIWIETGLHDNEIAQLRRTVGPHRGVDAWIGAALEWELVRRDLAVVAGAAAEVVAVAREALDQPRLPPTPALRRWLTRDTSGCVGDELPSLCLPARLVMRTPAHDLLGLVRAALEEGETADIVDRAAAAEGMTLEAWSLRAALQAMSGAATPACNPQARQESSVPQRV